MIITVSMKNVNGEIQVIENFLLESDFQKIKNAITDNSFPWYRGPVIANPNEIMTSEKFNLQFAHVFYWNHAPCSEKIKILSPLIDKIAPKAITKIKANLLVRTTKKIIHGFHQDEHFDCNTAVFYINSNNGETMFKNGRKIKSRENTFVTFPSQMLHSGTTNTCDKPYRIVLNLNYF